MKIQTPKPFAVSALLAMIPVPLMVQSGAAGSCSGCSQGRQTTFRKLGWVLAFIALVIVSGCGQSAADKAEAEFLKTYADFKMKTRNRDSTSSGLKAWSSRLHEADRKIQQTNIQRKYHELATNGSLGKAEGLIAARKMLDDSTYEQRIYSSTSGLEREITFALERVKELSTELEKENMQADQLLPELSASLKKYEAARAEDAAVKGESKRQSLEIRDAVEDTQLMISDAGSRRFNRRWNQEQEKTKKKSDR